MRHKETCLPRVSSLLSCYRNSRSKCGEVQGRPEQTPRALKGAPLSRAKGTAVFLGPPPFHGKNSHRMETTRAPAGPRLLRVAAPLGQVGYPALRRLSSERHTVPGDWDFHPDGLPWQTGTGCSVRGPQLRPPPSSTLLEDGWAPLLGSLPAECTALIPPNPLVLPAWQVPVVPEALAGSSTPKNGGSL